MILDKTSIIDSIRYFSEKTEGVRNRLNIELIKKKEIEKNTQRQSNVSFKKIQKSQTFHDSYTIKQIEVLMDQPNNLAFAVLRLSKLLIYEIYYDEFQPNFNRKIYNVNVLMPTYLYQALYQKTLWKTYNISVIFSISAI